LVDSAKHTAHEVNVKAQELEKSAEQKLESTEKLGKYYFISLFFRTYSLII
jgi:hypothetical protein